MKSRIIVLLSALACFGLIAGHATEASAQATRTWVSGVGDDVNPCSRTAPCKTFAGAISKTADGGIIDALDPGGFGAVTITKGITIRSTAEGGGILASGTNGVIVNAPGKVVNLINLQIDGSSPTSPGLNGVNVLAAAQVTIDGCLIQGFKAPSSGVGVRLANGAAARVTIKDTFITDNLIGVDINPTVPIFSAVLLDNVVVDRHPTAALRANTAPALFVLRRSTAIQTITLTNGAVLRSYGDNALPPNFAPTETVTLK